MKFAHIFGLLCTYFWAIKHMFHLKYAEAVTRDVVRGAYSWHGFWLLITTHLYGTCCEKYWRMRDTVWSRPTTAMKACSVMRLSHPLWSCRTSCISWLFDLGEASWSVIGRCTRGTDSGY